MRERSPGTFVGQIILAAHGAGDGSASNAHVVSCAQELQRLVKDVHVNAAFINGTPAIEAALRSAVGGSRLVLPLFTSNGFYADRLHSILARATTAGVSTTVLPPVGTHPFLIDAVAEYVVGIVAQREFSRANSAVIVVGHGTTRVAASADATRAVARAIAERTGLHTHPAFLDQSPTIENVIGATRACRNVAVLPFLFGGGSHAASDIPRRAKESAEQAGIPHDRLTILETLSGIPCLATVIYRIVEQEFTRRNSKAISLSRVSFANALWAVIG